MSRADDCERLLRILSDAPARGLSIPEIQVITAKQGEEWSMRTTNDILCAIMSQITHEKIREARQGKVCYYRLKGR